MDTMTITILDDGSLKIETGKIGPQNHMTAEAFLRFVAQAGGAKQERRQKHGVVGHHHHVEQRHRH